MASRGYSDTYVDCCVFRLNTTSTVTTAQHQLQVNQSTINRYRGIVGFSVPLDTLYVISETILRVTRPNQHCHGTEGQWDSQPRQGPIPPGSAH